MSRLNWPHPPNFRLIQQLLYRTIPLFLLRRPIGIVWLVSSYDWKECWWREEEPNIPTILKNQYKNRFINSRWMWRIVIHKLWNIKCFCSASLSILTFRNFNSYWPTTTTIECRMVSFAYLTQSNPNTP